VPEPPPPPDLGAIVHRVQSRFIRGAGAAEVFDPLLPELLAITGSEYGFVAEVWHDPAGEPYLKIFTLTDISWDDATRERVARERRDGLEFRNMRSLFGVPVRSRELVIANAPATDPRRGGLPRGHPPLDAFAGVPLFHGGELVGLVGLANRPGGYDEAQLRALEPLWSAVGAIIGAVQLARAKQRSEQALRESEALLGKLSRHVPGVIYQFVIDARGHGSMPYASDGLKALFGVDPHDVVGDARPVLKLVVPEHFQRILDSIAESAARLTPWHQEFEVQVPGRGRRWIEGYSMPERLPDGSTIWHGHLNDITERKQYEQALVAARAAERANLAKTEFLSRMSHELRTPLNAVLGFAQLMRLDAGAPLPEAQRARVQHIERAGAHLLAMINDVLDLSRIEAGEMALSIEPLRVETVAADALALVAGAATDAGVQLAPVRAGPALFVLGDRVRLRQVLVNLLSNAVKYNRRGGRVELRARPDGELVEIAVEDSGRGLTREQLGQLFQLFNRLGAERTGIEGTGIGLVITHRLVHLMGGTIDASSEPGRGSVFRVRLPVARAAFADTAPMPEPAAAEAPPPRAQRVVLYVEDNDVNVQLVREVLRLRPWCRLEVAASGMAALASAHRAAPDLLLIDMHLGDMTGLELADALDRRAETARVPRVALSADAMPERVRAARERGFAGYLTKPLDVQALLRVIDEQLG